MKLERMLSYVFLFTQLGMTLGSFAQNRVREECYRIVGVDIQSFSSCSLHKTSVRQIEDGCISILNNNISIQIYDSKYRVSMDLTGNRTHLNGFITERSDRIIRCQGMLVGKPTTELDKAMMKATLGFNVSNGNEPAFETLNCIEGQRFTFHIDLVNRIATLRFTKGEKVMEVMTIKFSTLIDM